MRFRSKAALAIALLCGVPTLAAAAPPTVTPSPGYDRRLQESRSDADGARTTATDAAVNPQPAPSAHHRKKRGH